MDWGGPGVPVVQERVKGLQWIGSMETEKLRQQGLKGQGTQPTLKVELQ